MRIVTGRDAMHLRDEAPGMVRHTVKVLGLAGPEGAADLTLEALVDHVSSRLPSAWPLREHVEPVLGGKVVPSAWVRSGVDVRDHVDHVVVGPGEAWASLDAVVARAATDPMDLTGPLWELTLVDDTGSGDQSLVLRLHHALAGGPQAVRLLELLFGPEPTGPDEGGGADEPVPAPGELVRFGLRRWGELARRLGEVPEVAGSTLRTLRASGDDMGAEPFGTPPAPWNRKVAGARATAMTTLPLPSLVETGRARGATVNHVLLTVTGGAVARLLDEAGAGQPLSTVVPVERHERTTEPVGNSSTSFGLDLAVALDPVARLDHVRDRATRARARHLGVDRRVKFGVLELGPAFRLVFQLGLVVGRVRRRPPYNLIVSLVRGPAVPLAVGGRTIASVTSFGFLVEDMGLNLTAWSVGDQLHVGIVVAEGALDPAALATALHDELDVLRSAVLAEDGSEDARRAS